MPCLKSHLFVCVLWSGLICQLAYASDWGYEDQKSSHDKQLTPMSTSVGACRPVNTASNVDPARCETVAKMAVPIKTNLALQDGKIIDYWLQLYRLASVEELTQEQLARYKQLLTHQINDSGHRNWDGILIFWPQLSARVIQHPEQKTLFVQLLRTLLRLQVNYSACESWQAQVLDEILGPKRIAVPGEPPLTEEAIDAYGDMACFLYEQNHLGRTIDAVDNRTMFATMICERFKNAPNQAAKLAMINFPLTWVKFKIIWANATPQQQQEMLTQFHTSDLPRHFSVADPVLDSILRCGPWRSVSCMNSSK